MQAIQDCLVTVLNAWDGQQPGARLQLASAMRKENEQYDIKALARAHAQTLVGFLEVSAAAGCLKGSAQAERLHATAGCTSGKLKGCCQAAR